MADALTTEVVRRGLERVTDQLEAAADELNRLDAEIGDGDLGVTMQRGARGLRQVLADLPDDVGMALLQCAQAFVKVSGSSYGTLIATGLMSAAKATRGREQVPWSEISQLLAGAGQAMAKRGRSELGQKTVLDAIEAARLAADGLDDPAGIQAAGSSRKRPRPIRASPPASVGPASGPRKAWAATTPAWWPSRRWSRHCAETIWASLPTFPRWRGHPAHGLENQDKTRSVPYHRRASSPPSTVSPVPVMKEAAGLARKVTA